MTQYAFHVDSSICTGCKTCQVACQDKNDLRAQLIWRRVYDYGGGSWEIDENGLYVPQGVFRYFLSSACNHCDDPACVAACAVGAMQKDPETGIVWTDHDACIGCEACAQACPYGAPVIDEVAGFMTKCDMCRDQVQAGGKPECVLSCSQRALDWGTVEEMVERYPGDGADVAPLPLPTTNPNVLIKAHPKAERSSEATGHIQNAIEEL